MEESNVIPFPVDNKRITKNPYEVSDRIIQLKLETIEDALDYTMPNIYNSFIEIGVEPSEEKMNLLEAVLRSIMHDHYNFEDDFNTFVDIFTEYTDHANEITEIVQERIAAQQ